MLAREEEDGDKRRCKEWDTGLEGWLDAEHGSMVRALIEQKRERRKRERRVGGV